MNKSNYTQRNFFVVFLFMFNPNKFVKITKLIDLCWDNRNPAYFTVCVIAGWIIYI